MVSIFSILQGLKFDTYAPRVLVTGLWINGIRCVRKDRTLLDGKYYEYEEDCFEHNQNSFNLECTMLNFHAAELNQYAYP